MENNPDEGAKKNPLSDSSQLGIAIHQGYGQKDHRDNGKWLDQFRPKGLFVGQGLLRIFPQVFNILKQTPYRHVLRFHQDEFHHLRFEKRIP